MKRSDSLGTQEGEIQKLRVTAYFSCPYVQVSATLLRCDVHVSKCFCGAFKNVGGIFRLSISRMFKKMLKNPCELSFGG